MALFDNMTELVRQWAPHRKYMCEAIETTNGTHTEDDVLAMILAGSLKFWPGEKCGVVTEFNQFPRMKVLNMFLIGGDPQNALDELLTMERAFFTPYARENGCKRITGSGRPGWTKVLTDYKPGGYFMYKDL